MSTKHRLAAAFLAPLALAASIATAAPAATAGTTPHRCYAQDLSVSVARTGAAAGSTYYRLTFRNEGPACTLYGYPGVSAAGSPAGPREGHAAVRDPGSPVLVVLKHGQSATAVLKVAETGNYPRSRCHPVAAAGLRVWVPGDFLAHWVPVPVTVCGRTRVHVLSVYPVRKG
jgi:hypothetical protein